MQNKYINLSVGDIEVQVKIEHEGIVVDVFQQIYPYDPEQEVIATTYKFYHELGVEVKELNAE